MYRLRATWAAFSWSVRKSGYSAVDVSGCSDTFARVRPLEGAVRAPYAMSVYLRKMIGRVAPRKRLATLE